MKPMRPFCIYMLSLFFAMSWTNELSAQTVPRQAYQLYFPSSRLRDQVAHLNNGIAAAILPAGIELTIYSVNRATTGEAEIHERTEEVFIAQSGQADVLLGDRLVGDHQIGVGEWRGGEIRNASRYHLKAGDLLWIPPRTAHKVMIASGDTFRYLALKSAPRNKLQYRP